MFWYHRGALSGSAAYWDTSATGRLIPTELTTSTCMATFHHRTAERRAELAVKPSRPCGPRRGQRDELAECSATCSSTGHRRRRCQRRSKIRQFRRLKIRQIGEG